MRVYAESSEASKEADRKDESQVLIYESPALEHPEDQQWVQLTYNSLRDENAAVIAVFDAERFVWIVDQGQYAGLKFTDLIVTT